MKKDTVAPKLISALPKKASTAIAKNEKITLTFSEDIKLGTGTVTLSSENDVQTLSTSQFSINGSVVTIKPLHNLLPNSHYTLKIDKGTFEDISGNQYAGINDIKTLFFDTIDTKTPQLKNTAAQNTTLATNANIVLTFDEPIKIGTGKITLNSEKDIRQISITDKQIKISGNTLTLNPTIDLNVASSYSLHIDAGAFKDSASAPNNSAAIDMTVNTSAKGDKQVPILQSYVDSKTANLSMQLNFQEAIKLGKGSFTLVDVANSKNKVVIPVTDSAQISIEKNVLSITPTQPLSPETQYSVTAPSGIIVDLSNNKFAGLTAKAPFVFDTHDKTPPTITLTDDKTEATHNLTLFEFNASEEIKEFTVDDITITGGTKGEFKQINPTHYTLAVTPNPNSTTPIKLAVAAEKFKDLVGNPNSVAVQSVQPVDTIAPTITIVDNKNTVASGPVLYVFTLSEPSNDFTADDINITDATKGEFTQRSQTLYTLSVTPKPNSTVPIKLAIAANTFTDLAGNSNTLAMQTVQEVDTASLTLSIEDDKTTVTNSPILYTFTLSAESNDFAVDDITVSGGIKGEFKAINPSNYTLSVTPEPNSTTPVSVNVAAGTFSNAAGSKNLAAEQHIQTIDTVSPLLKGSTPSNSAATTVLLNSDITLVFNENILAGTGSFIISNGSESQTISVNDSKQIIINNNILTINPTQNFVANTEYSVTYSSGIVTDKVGNFFNTSNSPSSFTFKTTNATTSKDNVTQTQAFTDKLNARALDGYLKDATVFVDVNGDGIQNPGEASTITDAYGRFELPNTKGTLVVSGGIDLTTGKPFIGTLKAPEGSKVLTPLTTLQQGFVEIGQTPEQAEQSIAKAFGLELSKIDLLNYDPIEEIVKSTQTPSTQSNATKVMANSAQIANFLVTAGKALQGATGDSDNLSTQNTSEALVKSLVNAIEEDVKYDDGKIDLANTTLLKTVIVQGAKEANVLAQKEAQSQGITTSKFDTTIYFDKVDKMTDTVAQVLSASAEKVATIAQSDQAFDALSLLTKIDKVSAFTQNVAGTSLQNTIAINNKKDDAAFTLALQEQANILTGNAATKAIDNQIVNTGTVVTNIEKSSVGTQKVTSSTLLFPGHTMGEWGSKEAFAAIKADGSVVTWGHSGYGGNSSSVTDQLDGKIDVVQVFSTSLSSDFAALRTDGSVVTWGDARWAGDSSSVADKLDGKIDVVQVFSAGSAFAALRADGSVVTWGHSGYGGNSSSVTDQLDGTMDVEQVFSTYYAFAALRADGSVVTWGGWGYGGNGGDSGFGEDSSSVADQLDGTMDVEQVFSTSHAFAALRADGSVVTWGYVDYGGDSSSVTDKLDGTIDVVRVFSNWCNFAALRADGSVVTWGNGIGGANNGGDSSSVADKLDGTMDVEQVFSTSYAFAALRTDGSVVTWGDAGYGGDSSSLADKLDGTMDVMQVFSNFGAFAALRTDGSVVTWGGDSSSVADKLDGTIDVMQVFSTGHAFAALRADGSVVTWGDARWAGDSSSVTDKLDGSIDVMRIFSTDRAFAALRADGSVVTWGEAGYGGDSSSVATELSSGVLTLSSIEDNTNLIFPVGLNTINSN